VIHRDIKPQNILLDKNGVIKIMDFGIAETVRSSMSRISNRPSTGTLVYMSPEQLTGENVGRQSDIYSFGATVYELLSGKPPFYQGDIQYQIVKKDAAPLEGVSEAISSIVLACLAKDRTGRPTDFGSVGKSLSVGEGLADSVHEGARSAPLKTSVQPEPSKETKGKKKGIPAVAIVGIVLGVLLLALKAMGGMGMVEMFVVVGLALAATGTIGVIKHLIRKKKGIPAVAIVGIVSGVSLLIAPGVIVTIGDIKQKNVAAQERVETEKLRPVEVFIQAVGLDIQRVAFNSDGSRIITSGGKGTTIWDVHAKKELKTVFEHEAYSMTGSKSGRYLITYSPVDEGKINICDFSNSTTRSLQIIPQQDLLGREITGLSITDDEKRFVFETGHMIKVFDIETLKEINEIKLKESHDLFNYRKKGLSLIPCTNDLLTISYDINISEPSVEEKERESQFLISIYDINGQEPKFNYSFKSKFIYSWAVSGDGKKLALLFMNKQIQIIDLLNGEHGDQKMETDGEITVIGFKDDKNLIFAGEDGVIGTYDIDKHQTRTIEAGIRSTFGAPACVDLAISNSGSTIAFCNGYDKLIVYDVPSNEITVFEDRANNILGAYYGSDSSLNILTSDKAYKQIGSNCYTQEFKVSGISGDQVRMKNVKTGVSEIFDASIARTIYSGKLEDEDKWYASFTQDGKFVFYGKKSVPEEDPDRGLYVADPDDAKVPPVRLENANDYGRNIKVFDDNKKVIMSGSAAESLGIWDMQTGKLLSRLNEQSGNARAFEFIDQNTCLMGTRGNVKVYDLINIKVLKTFTPNRYYGGNRDIEKIVFSKDKKCFATGDAWGLVTIWEFNKEHEVISFQTHKDGITSLAFSLDGKYIVSGSYHGKSAVINDVSTGRELARFVSFTDGEWILITPEGYFNASSNGAKYLNVRIGNSVYSIDNFYEKFYNPSYVASVLQGKKEETAADIRKGFASPPR
jgi:WD40 repeat protein